MLSPGDTIGIAAPSSCFEVDRLYQGVCCLKEMGFLVHIPTGIFDKKRYFAGEDHKRAEIINHLFADPLIKAIIAVRGGFGAMRMLDKLDWDIIKACPTLVMGFSDTTALLSALVDRVGSPVIHSPNLLSLPGASLETQDSFFRTLTGNVDPVKADISVGKGRTKGILKGGNLSVLNHLVGTNFQPDFTDSVVFFEDVGEPAYKIDRILSQMKMVGMFDKIRGLLIGDFSFCANSDLLPVIIEEIFSPLKIPILMGIKAGHGDINLSLPLGCMVSIDSESLEVSWEKA